MVGNKEISIQIKETEIGPNTEVHGKIELDYDGRFDSIVINSQIENSNDIFTFTQVNEKRINHPYARLSFLKKDLEEKNIIEFVAISKHLPSKDFSKVKFRTSIIQEHKEVANDIVFIKIKK
ncbi:MAG: hypothetical protein AB7F53_06255 [Nitrososphaeraceae archaeon]